jgi:hypothetical protein
MHIVAKKRSEADIAALRTVAYRMIGHADRPYEKQLSLVLANCLNMRSLTQGHHRLLTFLDKLLSQSQVLTLSAKARERIYEQADHFDPQQRVRRALTCLCAVVTVLTLFVVALGFGVGAWNTSTMIAAGASVTGVSAVSMTYLWRYSSARLTPMATHLRKLGDQCKFM